MGIYITIYNSLSIVMIIYNNSDANLMMRVAYLSVVMAIIDNYLRPL